MFDGDNDTAFYISRRRGGLGLVDRGALRIDLGSVTRLDRLIVRTGSEHALQPFKYDETIRAAVSKDLAEWTPMALKAASEIVLDFQPDAEIRYVRFDGTPERIVEIEGFRDGRMLNRANWRASQLFAGFARAAPVQAWQHSFTLDEIPEGARLAIALHGEHGVEGAYAALRVNGRPAGAPDRAVSYPNNAWENPPQTAASNYTYFVPLTPDMAGAKIDAVILGLRGGATAFKPEVWLTTSPTPFRTHMLTLTE